LKAITAKGNKGKVAKIATILPDTTSSARYVDFDAPMMREALTKAGLPSKDIIIQNGDGSDNTFYTDAVADIANHAKVLIIDRKTRRPVRLSKRTPRHTGSKSLTTTA
jgi:D-xylose transport system substrate-binding protein